MKTGLISWQNVMPEILIQSLTKLAQIVGRCIVVVYVCMYGAIYFIETKI